MKTDDVSNNSGAPAEAGNAAALHLSSVSHTPAFTEKLLRECEALCEVLRCGQRVTLGELTGIALAARKRCKNLQAIIAEGRS